jgi:tetratricopeptide (TPR) repeat protein
MTESATVTLPSAADPVFADLIEELTEKLQRGEMVDVDAYLREHADYADQIRPLLPALRMLADASRSGGTHNVATGAVDHPSGILGDFRILREVGRGGMGVVYQAEQISLGRQVALKVLPFAAAMDPRHLQRFRNEAQAAAHLHHTNIVPVFGVGYERGVHYYAMQFIDGLPLSAWITQQRRATAAQQPTQAYVPDLGEAPGSASETSTRACVTTAVAPQDKAFFRQVAEWGIQAAEALEHAHQLGVVHRDIKPANLLVDIRSNLWITDFGLAQLASPGDNAVGNLTMTGDLIGTLRYMSPEQALAKRVVVDHRTDVYSLGATLYELLTLEPVFGGRDRQEVLRQIAFEEPRPPRRLNRWAPAELETIVLKALEKNPADRFATTQELADDLGRYLRDEPIRARRSTLLQRARKWSRRHKTVVRAAAVCFLTTVTLLAASIGWVAGDRAERRARAADDLNIALREAGGLLKEGDWPKAKASIERAKGLLAGAGADDALQQRLKQVQADLEMVEMLESARLEQTSVKDNYFDQQRADPLYAAAFHNYDLPVLELEPSETARRITASAIRAQLMAALVDWAAIRGSDADYKKLTALVLLVEEDPWRRQVYRALNEKDWPRITRLAQDPDALDLSPTCLMAIGNIIATKADLTEAAVQFLRRAQQRHPDDFWINERLAFFLSGMKPHKGEEVIGFYRAALAVRPQSPGGHLNLGVALQNDGRLDEAIAAYREAIRLKPDYAGAHNNLGHALAKQRKFTDAMAEYREAIRLMPDDAMYHHNLGLALANQGMQSEAEIEQRVAIRLQPDYADAHNSLGNALFYQDRTADAVVEYHKAIDLSPDYEFPRYNLARALLKQSKAAEAAAECREVIRLKPALAEPHSILGNALLEQGKLSEAEAEFQEAVRLDSDHFLAHYNLASTFLQQRKFPDAIRELREALRIKPDDANAHFCLGNVLISQGKLPEAEAEFQETIRLQPNWASAYFHLGQVWTQSGQWDKAITSYTKALEIHPRQEAARENRGRAYVVLGQWDKAAVDLGKSLKANPENAESWCEYASVLLLNGDADGYRQTCRDAIDRFGKTENPVELYRLARLLALAPNDVAEPDQAVTWVEKAVAVQPKAGWSHHTLAVAHYRAGRFDRAIEACEKSMEVEPQWGAHVVNWLLLAMAHQRKEQEEEARKWLDKAKQWIDQSTKGKPSVARIYLPVPSWCDLLEVQLLLREADALIEKKSGR